MSDGLRESKTSKPDGVRKILRDAWHGMKSTNVRPSVSSEVSGDNIACPPGDGPIIGFGGPPFSISSLDVDTTSRAPETPSPSDSSAEKVKTAGSTAWKGLEAALRVLARSANVFPPLKSALGEVIAQLDFVQLAVRNREDFEELGRDFQALAETLNEYESELGPEGINGSVARIARSIEVEAANIKKQQAHGKIKRIIQSTQDQDDVIKYYRRIQALFQQLQNDIILRSLKTVDKQHKMLLLDRLSPVDDARYDSSYSTTIRRRGCTAETREKVQADLKDWVQDPEGAKVYWMNGMAGTGKTTIAYSLCEWLEANQLMGASFFCSRGTSLCRNVNRIIPTIASQLAEYSPAFRSSLGAELEANPNSSKLNVVRQFETLVRSPLFKTQKAIPESVTVVIDALDECEDDYGVRLIIETILRLATDLPLKFFVTSRPEPAICDTMLTPGKYIPSMLRLHDIEESLVEGDIRKYLGEALQAMSPAPSDDQITQLTKQSGKLFIYAATIVRYILPDKRLANSKARLEAVLVPNSQPTKEGTTIRYRRLDELYDNILTGALDAELEPEEIQTIQLVLKTVVCAKEPIPSRALASLLGLEEEQVSSALTPFQSVLHVSQRGGLVSPLHASFPDYMLDKSRSGELYCDRGYHNQFMAQCSFRLMKSQLRFNICNLQSSYIYDKDIQNLGKHVQEAIGAALWYACRHWGGHLELASASDSLRTMLAEFLTYRLLFWMEVLNLKRCIGNSVSILTQAQNWLLTNKIRDRTILQVADARKFATTFAASACSLSTCHLYLSLLVFCPRESSVYMNYSSRIRGGMFIGGTLLNSRRESALATWSTHSSVSSIATSPDGALVVAGLNDGTVWVGDSCTGEVVAGPIRGHMGPVHSVAYSPNGIHIASGSQDRTVRVWDARTGNPVAGPCKGHGALILSVSFSPDGTRIVSGSWDGTIRIWHSHTGNLVAGPFGGYGGLIYSVAFSPNGVYIALGSDNKAVQVLNADTGTPITRSFQPHTSSVTSVSFSPDGTRIVSGSSDTTIVVYYARTGNRFSGPFHGHTAPVRSVSFSSDSKYIVSGSDDTTARVWDACTGNLVSGPFQHTGSVHSATFSPDGTCVISGSWDGFIRVWDAYTRTISTNQSEGYAELLPSAAFSLDGTRIITGSCDYALQVWDVHTGDPISEPLQLSYDLALPGIIKRLLCQDTACTAIFSPDSARLASITYSELKIWDTSTGLEQSAKRPKGALVYSLAFSPDSARIVAGFADGTIGLWSLETEDAITGPFKVCDWRVDYVAFSSSSTCVISGSTGSAVQIWDACTGSHVAGPFLHNHKGSVSLKLPPNSTRIVYGSDDQTVVVKGTHMGICIVDPVINFVGTVTSIAYSPDGAWIAAGLADLTAVVWSSSTGDLVAGPVAHKERIESIAFSPDGTGIISCSADIIQMWSPTNAEYSHKCSGTVGGLLEERMWPSSGVPPLSQQLANITPISFDFEDSNESPILWDFHPDGWISSGDKLLFWIPPDLHPLVPRPPVVLSVFPHGSIFVEFLISSLGEKWRECYIS